MLLPVFYMRLSTSLVDTVATEEAAPMTRSRATIPISTNGASSLPVHIQVTKCCLSSTCSDTAYQYKRWLKWARNRKC